MTTIDGAVFNIENDVPGFQVNTKLNQLVILSIIYGCETKSIAFPDKGQSLTINDSNIPFVIWSTRITDSKIKIIFLMIEP
jgi:hypothetical protein